MNGAPSPAGPVRARTSPGARAAAVEGKAVRGDTLRLPALGIGSWAFGGGSYWGAQDQADVDRVVARALEAGLNYFDTAETYNGGASEESLGRALEGKRSAALIGTKVSPNHAYPGVLREHCAASLRRLRTDYLDLYMLHWPLNGPSLSHFTSDPQVIRNPPPISLALEEMERLRREGKVRHIGVSNFGRAQLSQAVSIGPVIAVNQVPYNLLMRAAEQDVLPFCERQAIGTIGYSALMQGLLARPLDSFAGVAPVRLRTRHFSGGRPESRHGEPGIEDETLAALQAIARIARGADRPMAEVALAWAMGSKGMNCTLVGCRTLAQLEANLPALTRPLADKTRRQLDEATAVVRGRLGARLDYFQSESQTRCW